LDSTEASCDKPASKSNPSSKPSSKAESAAETVITSKSKQAINLPAVEEDVEMNGTESGAKEGDDEKTEDDTEDAGGDEDNNVEDAADVVGADGLMDINGVRPKVFMKDGDEREVSSQSK
jgi:DNA ligase-1